MQCPSCKTANPDEYNYCLVCGARLAGAAPTSAPIVGRIRRPRKLILVIPIVLVVLAARLLGLSSAALLRASRPVRVQGAG